MQMTIRNIPDDVRERMEIESRARGVSLNQVALDALRNGFGLSTPFKRDLNGIAGTMSKADAKAILRLVAKGDRADIKAQKQERKNADRARHQSVRGSRRRSA